MPGSPSEPPGIQSSNRFKVFISYSRKDGAFAQELLTALDLLGFHPYLDKADIAPGEPWEDRLGSLIRMADSVVFVLSPHSVASKHCSWEVEEAARESKRLVPIVITPIVDLDVPEALRKINYVYFAQGQSFSNGLVNLNRALKADAGWIREHTRIGELAARWLERRKALPLLLRGSDLDDVLRWMAVRPADAPEISVNQMAFIEASSKQAGAELEAKRRLRWQVQIGLGLTSLVLAALALFVGYQWQITAATKEELAKSNVVLNVTIGQLQSAKSTLARQNELLESQNSQLETANTRLERKLTLRAAPLGNQPYDVPAGWYPIATKLAGAVAFIVDTTKPGEIWGSGVIVSGKQMNAKWDDKPVLVTAVYVVSAHSRFDAHTIRVENATLVFFGPKGERQTAHLGSVLWESDRAGVSMSSIAGKLPSGAVVIANLSNEPPVLQKIRHLTKNDEIGLFDQRDVLKNPGNARPIVFVGNNEGRAELTVMIGHLLGDVSAIYDHEPEAFHYDLLYTHATLPGASGSPIFDAATGDLIGIHLAGQLCSSGNACMGRGVSMPRILAEISAGTTANGAP